LVKILLEICTGSVIFSYRKIIFIFPLTCSSHLLFFKLLEFHVSWPYVNSMMWMLFCRDHLETYTIDYTAQVLVGYCVVYIFMQTFMIPGTVFMSLLAGALFGVLKGVALVVFTATAGASSCYFLSKLIGRPLVFSLWPDKLSFFQEQVNLDSCLSFVYIWWKIVIKLFLFTIRWLEEEEDCWTTCFSYD